VGLVLYAFLNARRERLGEIGEPVDNPPEQPEVELMAGPAVASSRSV
jgi:hypothetical protein